ncbi:MAG: Protein of unknown function rane [Frankiales bacterium]|nr:Protein of unknown function rane [Frankiales bacterium]
MLLILGFAVVLLGLVVVVADVSVVLLNQRAVAAAADGAALAASQELNDSVFYTQGLGRKVPLDEGQVRRVVAEYAADLKSPTRLVGRLDATRLTVVVEGSRAVSLPFGRFTGGQTVTVRSVARATSPVAG